MGFAQPLHRVGPLEHRPKRRTVLHALVEERQHGPRELPHQRDALISFTFNLGAGALETSTLLQLLNQGDYGSVPTQLNRWTKAGGQTLPGLVTRRKAEGALFSRGTYVS